MMSAWVSMKTGVLQWRRLWAGFHRGQGVGVSEHITEKPRNQTETSAQELLEPLLVGKNREWWVSVGLLSSFVLSRVIAVMVSTRGWFFTNDDWGYLTRDGIADVFQGWVGNITALVAAYVIAVRDFAGLDYWPWYPLFIALAWPTVGVAAWWAWRRRGVRPYVAAGGAVLLTWIGTSAYMQLGHGGAGYALAAAIVAIDFDERRLTIRNAAVGIAFGLFAAVASTIGAIIAFARLFSSVAHKKWNGVVSSGVAMAVFWAIRFNISLNKDLDTQIGIGDIPRILIAAARLVGLGMRRVIPFPASWILWVGLLVLAGAVTVLILSRFSYWSMALVIGGSVNLGAIAVVRMINPEGAFEQLLASRGDGLIQMRYGNMLLVVIFVAAVPLLTRFLRSVRWMPWAVTVAAAALLTFNIGNTLDTFDGIGDKSVPKAQIVAGVIEARADGGPVLDDAKAVSSTLFDHRVALTVQQVDFLIEQGWASRAKESDIFRVRAIEPLSGDQSRGLLRIGLRIRGSYRGTWSDLGVAPVDNCLQIDSPAPTFQVSGEVRFRLSPDPTFQAQWWPLLVNWRVRYGVAILEIPTSPLVIWGDRYGVAILEIPTNFWGPDEDGEPQQLFVHTMAPESGDAPTLTVVGSGIEMCLQLP